MAYGCDVVETCAVACTNDDIVTGLAQISTQVHFLASFIFIIAVLFLIVSVIHVMLVFANHR